jgi:hypothetical protein
VKKKQRVVILIEENTGEVLECPQDMEVVIIPWTRITEDHFEHPQFIDELEEALDADLDKAIEISKSLTVEPPDDGYDEDPRPGY